MRFQLAVAYAAAFAHSARAVQVTTVYSPTNASIFQLSADPEMQFLLQVVLSLAQAGGSSTGEILRIATGLIPGDFESTYTAFYEMAESVNAIAEAVNCTKDPVGAREAYFRAASYYRVADFFIISNQLDRRHWTLWDQQATAFDKAIALLPMPGERFSVPTYSPHVGNYSAIGIFYKASNCNRRTPTILVGSGYDGSQEDTYHSACVEILKRGINCVTYEGPGQPTVRRRQHIGFIPDWWTSASPVVDYLETRSDVDIKKLALTGVSFGGILAPLAASRDKRYSALITIDGLVSLQMVLEESFGPQIIGPYLAGNVTQYNTLANYIRFNATFPSSLRWILDQSLWVFNTTSPYEAMRRLGSVNVSSADVANITIPAFIAKGQDDTSTLDQPEILYDMMVHNRTHGAALTTYHEFLTSLGAGEHCSIGAESQVWQVVLNWLSDVWGEMAWSNGVAQF